MQCQTEFFETLLQFFEEPFGFVAVLEFQNEIVGLTHDNDFSTGVFDSPVLGPQIKNMVQEHICQKW